MNDYNSTIVGRVKHQHPTCKTPPYPDHKDKYFFNPLNPKNHLPRTDKKSVALIDTDFFMSDVKEKIDTNPDGWDKFELEKIENTIFAIIRKKISKLEERKSDLTVEDIEEQIEITEQINLLEKRLDTLNGCATNFIGVHHCDGGEADKDNFMGLPLFCGNVLCASCNNKNSSIHKRKAIRCRWLVDAFPDSPLGYLVLTVPAELREHFVNRNQLNSLFSAGVEVVRDALNPIGMMATFHFFGDKEPGYSPHLNILFPREDEHGNQLRFLLSKSVLTKIRQSFLLKLLELIPTESRDKFIYKNPNFLEDKTNCHYKFKKEIGQKFHVIKYCVRGVDVKKLADETPEVFDLFLELSGFRNVRWFGQFSNAKKGKFLESRNLISAKGSGFIDDVTILPTTLGEAKAKLFSFADNPEIGIDVDYPLYPKVDLKSHWDFLNESHKQLTTSTSKLYSKAVNVPHIRDALVNWSDNYGSLVKTSKCITDGPALVLANEALVTITRGCDER